MLPYRLKATILLKASSELNSHGSHKQPRLKLCQIILLSSESTQSHVKVGFLLNFLQALLTGYSDVTDTKDAEINHATHNNRHPFLMPDM